MSWPYLTGVVVSLLGPWIRTRKKWWLSRWLSLGLAESLFFAWRAYQDHLNGIRSLFGAMLAQPLRPGFPLLALGSILIGAGLWIIPQQLPRNCEASGFEPVL